MVRCRDKQGEGKSNKKMFRGYNSKDNSTLRKLEHRIRSNKGAQIARKIRADIFRGKRPRAGRFRVVVCEQEIFSGRLSTRDGDPVKSWSCRWIMINHYNWDRHLDLHHRGENLWPRSIFYKFCTKIYTWITLTVLQVDLLVSDYTGESWLTFIVLNPIDWVMQVYLFAPDYTCERLSFTSVVQSKICWVMQVDPLFTVLMTGSADGPVSFLLCW